MQLIILFAKPLKKESPSFRNEEIKMGNNIERKPQVRQASLRSQKCKKGAAKHDYSRR
jgi:hypothetical protein